MHVTLEYLAVGLLIVIILLAFNQVVGSLTTRLEPVREEQLYTVAERLMDKIVLTPGCAYPPGSPRCVEDWGTSIEVTPENLVDFGLALAGSRTPYILDPDKVMRLANLSTVPNPLLLNSSRLAELLALKQEYGFHFSMRPALYLYVDSVGCYAARNSRYYPSVFEVQMVNYYDVGVPNANVTAMYIFVRAKPGGSNDAELEDKAVFTKTCTTDGVGRCRLDYTSDLTRYFSDQANSADKWYFPIIIAYADWQGLTTVAAAAPTGEADVCGVSPNRARFMPSVEGYLIGNFVFINWSDTETVNVRGNKNKNTAAVHVRDDLLQAVPLYSDLLNFTSVTWCRAIDSLDERMRQLCNAAGNVLPASRRGFYLIGYTQYVDPLASHVFIFAKYRGNPVAIVFNRIPVIDITYGGSRPANAVTLRRLAVLFNYPYVVELTVWRRVEGWP